MNNNFRKFVNKIEKEFLNNINENDLIIRDFQIQREYFFEMYVNFEEEKVNDNNDWIVLINRENINFRELLYFKEYYQFFEKKMKNIFLYKFDFNKKEDLNICIKNKINFLEDKISMICFYNIINLNQNFNLKIKSLKQNIIIYWIKKLIDTIDKSLNYLSKKILKTIFILFFKLFIERYFMVLTTVTCLLPEIKLPQKVYYNLIEYLKKKFKYDSEEKLFNKFLMEINTKIENLNSLLDNEVNDVLYNNKDNDDLKNLILNIINNKLDKIEENCKEIDNIIFEENEDFVKVKEFQIAEVKKKHTFDFINLECFVANN